MNVILARRIFCSSLIACWLPFSSMATAPLQIKITAQEQSQQFSYLFHYQNKLERLQFSLSNLTVAEHFRQFRRYQPTYIQQYIWRDLQQHAASYPGIKLQRLNALSALRYQIKGQDPELIKQLSNELTALATEREAHYLAQMYYTQFRFAYGQPSIIPDHVRIVLDSLTDLAPVASAIKQQQPDLTPRQMLAYISNWLQQIPYQDLTDRQHSSGSSFNVPLKLLAENRGDCDSKAVLLAALIKIMFPKIKLAFIYPPNHALLAVAIKPKDEDETALIAGQLYVLVDATGPAQLQVGKISSEYKTYIQNGPSDYRVF